MSISDIFCLIIAWIILFAIFIIFIIVPIIAIIFYILNKIKDARDGAVIISFKDFRKIFLALEGNFRIINKYIFYKDEYKILVKFPFNPLSKMMVRQRARNRWNRRKQKAEYYHMREFISELEKDIAKISKESENYVAQAREMVERIGKQ